MTMSETKPSPWHVGQRVVIDGRTIVTIDRVTPSGRSVVGRRVFNADGSERGGSRYIVLQPLTEKLESRISLFDRGRIASSKITIAIGKLDHFQRTALPSMFSGSKVPLEVDVDKAERLVAAIRDVLDDDATPVRTLP